MSLRWAFKDPDEKLEYTVTFADRLGSDTIDTVNTTIPAGITANPILNNATAVTLWLTGGTAGKTYKFNVRITSVGGRIFDESVKLKIKDR